jgi:hypothetical protein
MRRSISVAVALATAACTPDSGPSMRPFEDCLGCHDGGKAVGWTVAGTWRRGSEITVVDAGGKGVTMHGNDVGNFYTREALTFPLNVWVDGTPMADGTGAPIPLRYGGCNACHRAETVILGDLGPEMLPGSDCLSCHGPGGIATVKLSAAGTVAVGGRYPAGATVEVAGNRTTANRVGNFFFIESTTPIAFPARPTSVAGSIMEGGAPHGSCNACHLGGVGSGSTVGGQ